MADRVIIEGQDNYGKPRQDYADRLAQLSEKEFVEEVEQAVWLSAYASNNHRSDYHWHADVCHDEAVRRGDAGLYKRGWERAARSAS